MNKITKLLMMGAFTSALSVVPVSAGTIDYQTYFKGKDVTVRIDRGESYNVLDEDKNILFSSKRDIKAMYSTTSVNIRENPSTDSKVLQTISIGTKVKRIGCSDCGWDIVKLKDGTKGFIWNEYLSTKSPVINLGTFRITYYCNCESCSEGYGRMTSTGNTCYSDYTIAVDPSVISYGTTVYINGNEYLADDCGGGINGNEIDIYVDHHDLTTKNGVDYFNVYVER